MTASTINPAQPLPRQRARTDALLARSLISAPEHVPELPAADLSNLPLVVLTAIAAALTLAGLSGLRRRDIG